MRRFRIDFTHPEKRCYIPNHGPFTPSKCEAQGVVFHDGSIVVKWMASKPYRTEHFESVDQLRVLNGGNMKIRWEDPICWRCGAHFEYGERRSGFCYGCGANQGKEDCFEDAPPGSGSQVNHPKKHSGFEFI